MRFIFCLLILMLSFGVGAVKNTSPPKSKLYRWLKDPSQASKNMQHARSRLKEAIKNPEYILKNWVILPSSPDSQQKKPLKLTLKEAILLALRYNPNIQNKELDRIIQRYQLRVAYNEFELQYALAGSANYNQTLYKNLGGTRVENLTITPEASLKTKLGTQAALRLNNAGLLNQNFNPLVNLSVTQPLLRGFGKSVNETKLLNALDAEHLNKLQLNQSTINQVTQVITSYRALVLSANNLQNQKNQLKESKRSYDVNEKKIKAGQLQPTGNIQQSYQIESLSLMVEQAENDFKNASQNLLQTIGLDPHMQLSIPNDLALKKVKTPPLKESIATALRQNVDYQALQLAHKANLRAFELAKNEQLWQLDLNGNVQTGETTELNGRSIVNNLYTGRKTTLSASLTLKVPIRDLNRRQQLIRAKVQLEKDRVNLLAAKRALVTQVTNLVNNIESQAKRYQLAKKQVKLALKAYELQKKSQEAGMSSALDVNNTQNQYIQAQSGLISAKIAYLNQLSMLQQLLGTTLDDWSIKMRYGE